VTYKIFDLPTHILVIHLVVVGIPVAALATIAIAVRPQWRSGKVGLAVVVIDALAVVGTWIARLSGEQFFNHNPGFKTLKQIVDHKNLGLTLIWYVLGLLVAAVLLVLAEKYERPPLTKEYLRGDASRADALWTRQQLQALDIAPEEIGIAAHAERSSPDGVR